MWDMQEGGRPVSNYTITVWKPRSIINQLICEEVVINRFLPKMILLMSSGLGGNTTFFILSKFSNDKSVHA